MESITENNKFIADFMGFEYIPFDETRIDRIPGWRNKDFDERTQKLSSFHKIAKSKSIYLCRNHEQLMYSNSWDWLMPVLIKISNLNDCWSQILPSELVSKTVWCSIYKGKDIVASKHGEGIIPVYEAVVEFIKHINKQKK